MQICISKYIIIITFLFFCLFFFFLDAVPDPLYCPNVQCSSCYTGIRRKSNLKRHLKHECGGLKKFQCSYCSKWYSQKSNLKAHSLRIHKTIL